MDVKPAAAPAAPPSNPEQLGATPAPAAPVPEKDPLRPDFDPPTARDGVLAARAWAMPLMDSSGLVGLLPGSGDPFAGAVQESSGPQPSVYRAARGDTFHSVAQKLGVPLHDLQAANPAVKKVRAGQL